MLPGLDGYQVFERASGTPAIFLTAKSGLTDKLTISGQIRKNLAGKIISYIEVLHTPHRFAFFHGDIKNYGNL